MKDHDAAVLVDRAGVGLHRACARRCRAPVLIRDRVQALHEPAGAGGLLRQLLGPLPRGANSKLTAWLVLGSSSAASPY